MSRFFIYFEVFCNQAERGRERGREREAGREAGVTEKKSQKLTSILTTLVNRYLAVPHLAHVDHNRFKIKLQSTRGKYLQTQQYCYSVFLSTTENNIIELQSRMK